MIAQSSDVDRASKNPSVSIRNSAKVSSCLFLRKNGFDHIQMPDVSLSVPKNIFPFPL